MKRSRMGLGSASLLAVVGLFMIPWMTFAAEPAGKVVAAEGQVLVFPAGSSQGRQALPGAPVYEGETVEVARGARAKLLMADDSVLSLAEGTRLALTEYRMDPKEKTRASLMQLATGKLRALVSRLMAYRSQYQIVTPTAVMGVRGTFFAAWTMPDPERPGHMVTWLLCMEGAMDAASSNPTVKGMEVVLAGYICEIKEGEPPSKPRRATVEEMDRALMETEVPLAPGQTFLLEEVTITALEITEVERRILENPPLGIPVDVTQGPTSTEPLFGLPGGGGVGWTLPEPPLPPPGGVLPAPPPPPGR